MRVVIAASGLLGLFFLLSLLNQSSPVSAETGKRVTVVVKLNPDRTKGGTLTIINEAGKVLLGPLPVLGKAAMNTAAANKNPEARVIHPFGDTPEGTYVMRSIRSTSDLNQKSYGPNGAIVLEPVGGTALIAKENGRTGVWIHGGATGKDDLLRRTNGCLRVFNADMTRIIDAIAKNSVNASANRCEVQEMSVQVFPDGGDDDYNAGDPPPTSPGTIIFP
jgi:hypothetical protein